MREQVIIQLRNKKARALLQNLEDLNLIKIVAPDPIPKHWPESKRKRAKEFLEALKEAKLAEEGKIELKTAQSLIDEL